MLLLKYSDDGSEMRKKNTQSKRRNKRLDLASTKVDKFLKKNTSIARGEHNDNNNDINNNNEFPFDFYFTYEIIKELKKNEADFKEGKIRYSPHDLGFLIAGELAVYQRQSNIYYPRFGFDEVIAEPSQPKLSKKNIIIK